MMQAIPPNAALSAAAKTSQPQAVDAPRSGASGTIGSMAAAPMGRFESLAQKYDVRSLTPYEIDQMAEQLPTDGPGDIEFKLHFLTYGAEFQRGLQKVIREATGDGLTEEELEAKLSQPVDLIALVEDQLAASRASGDATEAKERFLARLYGLEARAYMPEGGVRV